MSADSSTKVSRINESEHKEQIITNRMNMIDEYDFCSPSELLAEESQLNPPKKKKLTPMRSTVTNIKYTKKMRMFRGMKSNEIHRILSDNAIPFCRENGLFSSSVQCSCGKQMTLTRKDRSSEFAWQCRRGPEGNKCKVCFTMRKGTWFENSRLSTSEILWMAYMWLYDYSFESMLHECDHSPTTLLEWLDKCQNLCQAILENKREPIGGKDKLVEIFECKYPGANENCMIFCALEQFSCKTLVVLVKNVKSSSLVKLFENYILPESVLITNIWKAFSHLTCKDFNYLRNQKLLTFYDTVTKAEIKSYDILVEIAKRPPAINHHTKFVYSSKFCETFYRRSLSYSDDAFITFLQDIAKVYPPITKHVKK